MNWLCQVRFSDWSPPGKNLSGPHLQQAPNVANYASGQGEVMAPWVMHFSGVISTVYVTFSSILIVSKGHCEIRKTHNECHPHGFLLAKTVLIHNSSQPSQKKLHVSSHLTISNNSFQQISPVSRSLETALNNMEDTTVNSPHLQTVLSASRKDPSKLLYNNKQTKIGNMSV